MLFTAPPEPRLDLKRLEQNVEHFAAQMVRLALTLTLTLAYPNPGQPWLALANPNPG